MKDLEQKVLHTHMRDKLTVLLLCAIVLVNVICNINIMPDQNSIKSDKSDPNG